jgi:hypothetical protein
VQRTHNVTAHEEGTKKLDDGRDDHRLPQAEHLRAYRRPELESFNNKKINKNY